MSLIKLRYFDIYFVRYFIPAQTEDFCMHRISTYFAYICSLLYYHFQAMVFSSAIYVSETLLWKIAQLIFVSNSQLKLGLRALILNHQQTHFSEFFRQLYGTHSWSFFKTCCFNAPSNINSDWVSSKTNLVNLLISTMKS